MPTIPLTITHPAFGEPSHTSHHIGCVEALAEVKVLHLDHVLTGLDATRQVLMLTDGVREASSSILHSTYATLAVSISDSLWAGLRGVPPPPGPFLYPTPSLYNIVLYLSTTCGNIL